MRLEAQEERRKAKEALKASQSQMDGLLKMMSTLMMEKKQTSGSAEEGAADRDSPRGVSPGSAQH